MNKEKTGCRLDITAASEEGIREAAIVVNGDDTRKLQPDGDGRIFLQRNLSVPMEPDSSCYVRITTERNNMAWSSPGWAE